MYAVVQTESNIDLRPFMGEEKTVAWLASRLRRDLVQGTSTTPGLQPPPGRPPLGPYLLNEPLPSGLHGELCPDSASLLCSSFVTVAHLRSLLRQRYKSVPPSVCCVLTLAIGINHRCVTLPSRVVNTGCGLSVNQRIAPAPASTYTAQPSTNLIYLYPQHLGRIQTDATATGKEKGRIPASSNPELLLSVASIQGLPPNEYPPTCLLPWNLRLEQERGNQLVSSTKGSAVNTPPKNLE
ncbi:hypothetical protein V8F20_004585 [Naviculisporaceae sp. PSN 640]